jgi:hypothetical protein
VAFDDVDHDADDFLALGDDYERAASIVAGPIACGAGRLLRIRPLVDYAQAWIDARRS